jgi:hypothetical protein
MKFYKIFFISTFFLFNTDSYAQSSESAEIEEVIVTAQKKRAKIY